MTIINIRIQNSKVEGCVLNLSCMNTKIALGAEQPSTGQYWITPKEDTPYLRAKEYLQQDGMRGAVTFKVKSQTHQRCSEGTNKILCAPGPRERSSDFHKRRSQTCLWVFECLLRRCGTAVTCRGDRGSGCSSTWTENSQMFKLDLEKSGNQRSNCQPPLDHRNSKRIPERHLLLLHWLC